MATKDDTTTFCGSSELLKHPHTCFLPHERLRKELGVDSFLGKLPLTSNTVVADLCAILCIPYRYPRALRSGAMVVGAFGKVPVGKIPAWVEEFAHHYYEHGHGKDIRDVRKEVILMDMNTFNPSKDCTAEVARDKLIKFASAMTGVGAVVYVRGIMDCWNDSVGIFIRMISRWTDKTRWRHMVFIIELPMDPIPTDPYFLQRAESWQTLSSLPMERGETRSIDPARDDNIRSTISSYFLDLVNLLTIFYRHPC